MSYTERITALNNEFIEAYHRVDWNWAPDVNRFSDDWSSMPKSIFAITLLRAEDYNEDPLVHVKFIHGVYKLCVERIVKMAGRV